jgi:hypothetical protein
MKLVILAYVSTGLRRTVSSFLSFLLIPLIPLVPLLRLDNSFYGDWRNHVWLIGYYGEYFRRHGSFPIVLNTNHMIGMPFPLFYGFLFYPIAGLVSAVLGGNLTLRLVVLCAMLLQCFQIRKTAVAAGLSPLVAGSLVFLSATAIYPMTNLYNRAAITEFIGASLLVSAFCCVLRILLEPNRSPWSNGLQAGLWFTLAAGTHPITSMLGGAYLFWWAAFIFFRSHRKRRPALARMFACLAVLGALALSPWLYALREYQSRLEISRLAALSQMSFLEGIDDFTSRFASYPYDGRSLISGTVVVTPFLDAQINFPLFLLTAFLSVHVIRTRREYDSSNRPVLLWAAITVAAFVALGIASVWAGLWSHLPFITGIIQFSYRLVTYLDLLLLAAALLLLWILRMSGTGIEGPLKTCLAVCCALALQNALIKYTRAWGIQEYKVVPGTELHADRGQLVDLPIFFYGVTNYSVVDVYGGDLSSDAVRAGYTAALTVDAGPDFGRVPEGHIDFQEPVYAITNILPFPWNHVLVNGREVPFSEMKLARSLAIPMKAGASTVQYRLAPAPLWLALRRLSFATVLIWAMGVLVIVGRNTPRRLSPA